jgi:hypothetical protein
MTPTEHRKRWDALSDEALRDYRRRKYAPLWQAVWWGAVFAAVLATTCLATGKGCGDVGAEPAATVDAAALAARFLRWQPTWRPRRPDEAMTVASAIVAGCRETPWPSADRCPWLTAALAMREASWHVDAIGRRGEVGLMQLHGAALAGHTRDDAAEPETNVKLGLAWLRRCSALCGMAGHRDEASALSAYAGLRCRPSNGSRLVLAWEQDLWGVGHE